MIKTISFKDFHKPTLTKNAIIRDQFPGFKEDYLCIHQLLVEHKSKRVLEIGTSTGQGTDVISNAIGVKKWQLWKKLTAHNSPQTLSIDVPPGTDPKIIYPQAEDGHPFKAGAYSKLPYFQLFGDSTKFDYSSYYPLDTWFIDGKHDFPYASADTKQALKANPKLVIWHDMQIDEVAKAVEDTMKSEKFKIFRIAHTRIGYALKAKTTATKR